MSMESAVETTVSLLDIPMKGDPLAESSSIEQIIAAQHKHHHRKMPKAITDATGTGSKAGSGGLLLLDLDSRALVDLNMSGSGCDLDMDDEEESTCSSSCSSSSRSFAAASATKKNRKTSLVSTKSELTEDLPNCNSFGHNVHKQYINWHHNSLATSKAFGSRRELPSQSKISFQIKRTSSTSSTCSAAGEGRRRRSTSHQFAAANEHLLAAAQALWQEPGETEETTDHKSDASFKDSSSKSEEEVMTPVAQAVANLATEATAALAMEGAEQPAYSYLMNNNRRSMFQQAGKRGSTGNVLMNTAASSRGGGDDKRAMFVHGGKRTSAGNIMLLADAEYDSTIVTRGGLCRDLMVTVGKQVMAAKSNPDPPESNKPTTKDTRLRVVPISISMSYTVLCRNPFPSSSRQDNNNKSRAAAT